MNYCIMVLSKGAERHGQLTARDITSSDDAIHVTRLKDKVKNEYPPTDLKGIIMIITFLKSG